MGSLGPRLYCHVVLLFSLRPRQQPNASAKQLQWKESGQLVEPPLRSTVRLPERNSLQTNVADTNKNAVSSFPEPLREGPFLD